MNLEQAMKYNLHDDCSADELKDRAGEVITILQNEILRLRRSAGGQTTKTEKFRLPKRNKTVSSRSIPDEM